MKLETDEEAYALHRYAKCHGISDEATFDIASWGYRMGLERAARKCEQAGKLWAESDASSLNDRRKKECRRDEAFVLAAAIGALAEEDKQ